MHLLTHSKNMTSDHANIVNQLLDKLSASVGEGGITGSKEEIARIALEVVREKKRTLDAPSASPKPSQKGTKELVEDISLYKEKNKALEKRVAVLEENLASNAELSQITVEYMMAEQESIQEVKKELEELQEKYAQLMNSSEKEQLAWKEQVEQWKEQEEALKAEVIRLEEKEKEWMGIAEKWEQTNTELTQKEIAYQEEIQQLKSQQEMLAQDAQQKGAEAQKLQEATQDLAQAKQQLQEQEVERSKLSMHNEELIKQLDELKGNKKKLEQQMREELEDLKKEVQDSLHQEAQVQQGAFRNSLSFTQKLNQAHFQNKERLLEVFPNTSYFALPSEVYNGNLLHVAEKFGVTYLIIVRAMFEGLEGQIFKMAANFALNNIVKVKKYINSSKLIEEFFYSMEPSLSLLERSAADIEIGVCLIDTTNLELEYSSSGFPLYVDRAQKELIDVHGGKNDPDDMVNKRFGLKNLYKVKKLNLLKDHSILLSSVDLSANMLPIEKEGSTPYSLYEFMINKVHLNNTSLERELRNLFNTHHLEKEGDNDLLIARIGF